MSRMLGLGVRLAVSGGRESIVRLVLTAVGVAIGTTLLLLAAAADPAVRAHQRHQAWQFTEDQSDAQGADDPLLWQVNRDSVDGHEMLVLHVAGTGPGAPAPPGLSRVPSPGEVHVSPPLAAMIEQLPADRLADRFPSAPSGVLGRDVLAGPDELVAVVGVPVEELRDEEGVLEVHEVRTRPAPYQFTDFLRVVVGVGAVGLLMPVLVFVGTSTRLGAARREQRFAALRLAGATPRQTNVLAAVEAAAAGAVGSVLGAVGYALLRSRVATIEIDGHESFVQDVHVAPALLVALLLAIPLLAVGAAMFSLRRLQISPLGVARRAVRSRPTAKRLLPLVVGGIGFGASLWAATRTGNVALVPVMATFALMIYGIVVAGPWFTVLAARAIGRVGRRASALLAGRRLEDDPAAGFRAVSGLVLAVFVASVFSGVTPAFVADNADGGEGIVEGATMSAALPAGSTSAEAEAVLAAARAAGSGPGVVLRADPDPQRPLVDPAAGRGPGWLVRCADLSTLGIDRRCPDGVATVWIDPEEADALLEPSPYTEAEAAAMPATRLIIGTDGTPATTDRIRTAIQREAPGAFTLLGAESENQANRRLSQLNRLANLALALTLVIAGCGLAVAVAGGIIERKRPFALLRLSGMHLRELQRTALLEASAPLLLIALASALLGLAISAVIVVVAGGIPWQPPTLDYWVSLVAGLAAAVGVAAATLPLLGRTTAPSAVRFE